MPRMLNVALPVLSSVMVCGTEILPTSVFTNVREFWDARSEAIGAVFDGDAMATGVEVPVRSIKSGLEVASLSMTSEP